MAPAPAIVIFIVIPPLCLENLIVSVFLFFVTIIVTVRKRIGVAQWILNTYTLLYGSIVDHGGYSNAARSLFIYATDPFSNH